MDFLEDLISSHSSDFLSVLTESGFSSEQAEEFLPEAGQSVTEAVKTTGLTDLLGGDASTAISSILEHIDISSLAGRLGMDETMVDTGITAMITKFLDIAKDEGGGLSSLLGGEGREGLLGNVGKLLGKFFK